MARKIKILWTGPGEIDVEFTAPEKLADDAKALFFKVPKSFSNTKAKIESNMQFIEHLQNTIAEQCGRQVPCFLIPEEVEMVQVSLTPEDPVMGWDKVKKLFCNMQRQLQHFYLAKEKVN